MTRHTAATYPRSRLRLLVVAPCNADDVGEAWVGYQWVRHLSQLHDVTLLSYRKRGAASVARRLPGVRVVEWLEPPLVGRAERLNSLMKPAYLVFHRRARRWIRAAQSRGEVFDMGHQPVPVGMRYPSPLTGTGIPFVLGPVGGSLDTPPELRSGDTAPWYVSMRRLDALRIRHDPFLRRTYETATCVLGIADYVRDFLAPVRLRRFEVMSETGLEVLPDPVDRGGRTGPVRLLFVGRLIRTKGLRDAIAALHQVRDTGAVLDVVGDGFDRAACEQEAARLELTDRVRFHGAQPRDRVEDFYRAADVFVYPSFREPGGNVPFEAMGHGLPLIVCDRGGPASAVDDTCAVRVPVGAPDAYARDIGAAIRRLVEDAELRLKMGEAARERVAATALWEGKARSITALYRELLEEL
jgi:glycosyltransferase involved in cell wall biosynthesis